MSRKSSQTGQATSGDGGAGSGAVELGGGGGGSVPVSSHWTSGCLGPAEWGLSRGSSDGAQSCQQKCRSTTWFQESHQCADPRGCCCTDSLWKTAVGCCDGWIFPWPLRCGRAGDFQILQACGWQAQPPPTALLACPGADRHKQFLTYDQTIGYFICFVGVTFKGRELFVYDVHIEDTPHPGAACPGPSGGVQGPQAPLERAMPLRPRAWLGAGIVCL